MAPQSATNPDLKCNDNMAQAVYVQCVRHAMRYTCEYEQGTARRKIQAGSRINCFVEQPLIEYRIYSVGNID